MSDQKDIADYYLDRYRSMVSFANTALGIAVLILMVNWIGRVEPNYETFKNFSHGNRLRIHKIEKKLEMLNRDSARINTAVRQDSAAMNGKKSLIPIQEAIIRLPYDLRMKKLSDVLIRSLSDSLRHKLKANGDTLKHPPAKNSDEKPSDYNWGSLISFVMTLAADPKQGSLYLMGLIALMLIFATIYRWNCLHYLSRAIRLYKLDPNVGLNSYMELKIVVPFWLNPVPRTTNKAEDRVTYAEIKKFMGYNDGGVKSNVPVYLILLLLLLLQIRLLYIDIHINDAIRFDFVFVTGMALLLISCYIVVCFWYVPLSIDDHFNNEPRINNINRRLFILVISVTGVSLLLKFKTNMIGTYYAKNKKRFRHKKKQKRIGNFTGLQPGLYAHRANPKQKTPGTTLCFFNAAGYSIALNDIHNESQAAKFKANLKPINFQAAADKEKYHFNSRHRSWTIENYTLYLLEQSKIEDALYFIYQSLTSPTKTIQKNDEDDDPTFYYIDSYINTDAVFRDGLRLSDLAVKLFLKYDKSGHYLSDYLAFYEKRLQRISEKYGPDKKNKYNLYRQWKRKLNWGDKKWKAREKRKKPLTWHHKTL